MTLRGRYKDEKSEFTIEIIEHYPNKKFPDSGTFHAYWEEQDMDFRGIRYIWNKQKKNPWFQLPGAKGEIDGEKCQFTLYAFGDLNKMKRFMFSLRAAFTMYMKQQKRR